LAGFRQLGISASATGYIPKSELPSLYSALDAYLLTSRVEGGPCTVFEAMACNTVVIATRVGAVPDLIVDGLNGYSAEVNDVETLVNAINEVGSSPEKRNQIGARARETVVKLPWGTALAPLEAVYDDLVRSRRHSAVAAPRWLSDPQQLLHTASAADALSNVIDRIRRKSITPFAGWSLLLEMLDRKSPADVLRGLAMLRGITHRYNPTVPS
jgi:hypothetical protein